MLPMFFNRGSSRHAPTLHRQVSHDLRS
jgi:hypothetical protein